MQALVRSAFRTLLKQSSKVDSDVSIRAMLCASPIQVYDRNSHQWVHFNSSREWHDSRKVVDSLIRKLNGGREWFHPPEEAKSNPTGESSLTPFVRASFRTNPCTSQNLNMAFAAVKSLNHTLRAADSLKGVPPFTPNNFGWGAANFKRQSKIPPMPEDDAGQNAAGAHLLVAHPLMPGFFRHTVILLHRSDVDGAFGLILNRPLTNQEGVVVPVWSALPDSHPLLAKHLANNAIMVGGPVTHTSSMEPSLLCLHKFGNVKDAVALTRERECDVFAGGDMDELAALFETGKATADDFMVVLGYSGWGHDQLEGEMDRGSWFCTQLLHANHVAEGSSTRLSDFVLRASRAAGSAGLRRVDDPKETWCSVMHGMGGSFSSMTSLHSLSKLQFDDDNDQE